MLSVVHPKPINVLTQDRLDIRDAIDVLAELDALPLLSIDKSQGDAYGRDVHWEYAVKQQCKKGFTRRYVEE